MIIFEVWSIENVILSCFHVIQSQRKTRKTTLSSIQVGNNFIIRWLLPFLGLQLTTSANHELQLGVFQILFGKGRLLVCFSGRGCWLFDSLSLIFKGFTSICCNILFIRLFIDDHSSHCRSKTSRAGNLLGGNNVHSFILRVKELLVHLEDG
jgi:hypothetical protein